jgi:hypothetical protein
VLAIINLLVRDEVIPHISHLDRPDEVWNALKEFYEFVGITTRLILRNKFCKMSMQETSSMAVFLFIVKDLLGQIVGVCDVIRDQDVVRIVLNALPDSYESFVQSVST